jgi:hydrogenase-4 component B
VKTRYPGIAKIFPDPTAYSSKVADVAETGLDRLLIQPMFQVLSKLRWIQHGYIQLYIGYIILTIAVLLLVS